MSHKNLHTRKFSFGKHKFDGNLTVNHQKDENFMIKIAIIVDFYPQKLTKDLRMIYSKFFHSLFFLLDFQVLQKWLESTVKLNTLNYGWALC